MIESIEASSNVFTSMLPELQSRCEAMCRRAPKVQRQDLADDALAVMFLNHTQAAKKGRALQCTDLGWAAVQHLRHRSWINMPPLGRQGQNTVSFETKDDDVADRIAAALSTDERADPAERCRVRIDWKIVCGRLSPRHRRIVHRLAFGYSKRQIAASLRITPGRLSQLLDDVRREILWYVADRV